MKKRESQDGELDQFKLKTIILHDNRNKEVHIFSQLVGFVAAKSVSTG